MFFIRLDDIKIFFSLELNFPSVSLLKRAWRKSQLKVLWNGCKSFLPGFLFIFVRNVSNIKLPNLRHKVKKVIEALQLKKKLNSKLALNFTVAERTLPHPRR